MVILVYVFTNVISNIEAVSSKSFTSASVRQRVNLTLVQPLPLVQTWCLLLQKKDEEASEHAKSILLPFFGTCVDLFNA